MHPKEILKNAKAVLVIDWPSKEVPETLARAGLAVFVRGGPGPEDFSSYEIREGAVLVRHIGRPPERVDLVYSFRPLRELPEIIAMATRLGAKTLWTQSGLSPDGAEDARGCWLPEAELQWARNLAGSAGLTYVSEPYIAGVAREIQTSR